MNLIENGSFESGQLPPWTVDFGEQPITIEQQAALLAAGTQISQSVDPARVSGLESVVFKVRARASMAGSAETLKVKCRFRFGVRCHYSDQIAGNIELFDASGGMRSFASHLKLIPGKPLVRMDVVCSIDGFLPGPDYDLRDIWFTGFEVVPGPAIP